MANGLNRVMLIGNLGADPELRTTSGGQSVLKIRMVTNESYKDRSGEWKEKAEWHSIVVWGKRAEALSKILDKGKQVYVEGSLRTSSYEDREGVKRYKTEIQASNVILCGAPGLRSGRERNDEHSPDDNEAAAERNSPQGGDDDIPF